MKCLCTMSLKMGKEKVKYPKRKETKQNLTCWLPTPVLSSRS